MDDDYEFFENEYFFEDYDYFDDSNLQMLGFIFYSNNKKKPMLFLLETLDKDLSIWYQRLSDIRTFFYDIDELFQYDCLYQYILAHNIYEKTYKKFMTKNLQILQYIDDFIEHLDVLHFSAVENLEIYKILKGNEDIDDEITERMIYIETIGDDLEYLEEVSDVYMENGFYEEDMILSAREFIVGTIRRMKHRSFYFTQRVIKLIHYGLKCTQNLNAYIRNYGLHVLFYIELFMYPCLFILFFILMVYIHKKLKKNLIYDKIHKQLKKCQIIILAIPDFVIRIIQIFQDWWYTVVIWSMRIILFVENPTIYICVFAYVVSVDIRYDPDYYVDLIVRQHNRHRAIYKWYLQRKKCIIFYYHLFKDILHRYYNICLTFIQTYRIKILDTYKCNYIEVFFNNNQNNVRFYNWNHIILDLQTNQLMKLYKGLCVHNPKLVIRMMYDSHICTMYRTTQHLLYVYFVNLSKNQIFNNLSKEVICFYVRILIFILTDILIWIVDTGLLFSMIPLEPEQCPSYGAVERCVEQIECGKYNRIQILSMLCLNYIVRNYTIFDTWCIHLIRIVDMILCWFNFCFWIYNTGIVTGWTNQVGLINLLDYDDDEIVRRLYGIDVANISLVISVLYALIGCCNLYECIYE